MQASKNTMIFILSNSKYYQTVYYKQYHTKLYIYRMGGCIQKCCMSEAGTICCNIISILGLIYFVLTWAMFDRNFNYFEFHIPKKSDTRLSCIVAALIYLGFFIWTLYRLNKINKQKAYAQNLRDKKSLQQGNNIPSVYSQGQKPANISSEREMMREQ